MDHFAGLNPPADVVELGTPERVYRSPTLSSAQIIATNLFAVLAVLVGGGLLVLKEVLGLIPEHASTMVYVVAGAFLGGAALMYLGMKLMQGKKPSYLYAFYPVGLVICQKGQWGLVPWVHVRCVEEKHASPALVLENGAVIPVVHDFIDGHDLMHDIRQCVLAKDGLLGRGQVFPVDQAAARSKGAFQMLLAAVLLIGVGTATFILWDWMVEMNAPARVMTHDELVQLKDPTTISRGWVSIDVPQVIKTDVEIEKRLLGVLGTTESKLVLIPINDQYLIANVKNDFKGGKGVKGVLAEWKGGAGRYSETRRKAVEMVAQGSSKYRDKLLSFQFDADVPLESNAKVVPAILAVGGVVGLVLLLVGWSRWRSSRRALKVSV